MEIQVNHFCGFMRMPAINSDISYRIVGIIEFIFISTVSNQFEFMEEQTFESVWHPILKSK